MPSPTISPVWRDDAERAIRRLETTVTDVAGDLDVSRQYLTRLLTDSPTIPEETYRRICERLGLDHAKYVKQETDP